MSKVVIDRAVVEQALECLEGNISYDFHGNPYEESDELMQTAAANLRAALEHPQVETATVKDCLQVPAGFVLLQTESGIPVYAACLDGGRFHGWLMWMHPDGQWVSKRRLEPWELMQVEDQRDYGIVRGD